VNPADLSNSSTIQGRNVVNIAVEYHNPHATTLVADEFSTNNANIAQTAIVIDDDDTASQGSNNPMQLYHFCISEQNHASALAVAEMQAKRAAVGCAGFRKQDKVLLRELASNISTRNH
jgi:hypothetical protein